jgi:acetyl/propionyl-CoA carboxylase alpha subunit
VSYRLQVDGQEVSAAISARRPQLRVRIGVRHFTLENMAGDATQFSLSVDGRALRGFWYRQGALLQLRFAGRTYQVTFGAKGAAAAAAACAEEVRASMPGVVVTVHCMPGEPVEAGAPLVTIESMKLQMTLVATHAARVAQVHVAPQAQFERGALLVSLAPRGELP